MIKWKLERGKYSIGCNPYVAVVEIGDYKIDLPKTLYGIKGNLFTPNIGIEKIIRNVLRTGTIKYLVITGNKDVPYFYPYQALKALFKNGVDDEMRIIGAKGFNPILKNLSKREIEEFRQKVKLIDCFGKKSEEVVKIIREIVGDVNEKIILEYIEKFELQPFPNVINGILIRAKNIVEAWKLAIRHVALYGFRHISERGSTREILNMIVIIEDPKPMIFPHIPQEELEKYFKESFFNPTKRGSEYTYGERLLTYARFDEIIKKLRKSPGTRRAVLVLWDPSTDTKISAPPCMCYVQFLVRNNRLFTTVIFRSHDVLNAYPFNLYAIVKLHEKVCKELGVDSGHVIIHSISAHIYEDTLNMLQLNQIIKDEKWEFIHDQLGYVTIFAKNDKIVAEHYSPDNRLVQIFECSSGDNLEHMLAKYLQGLRPEHYIWIGREIGKLEKDINHSQ